jgi:DNA gyrase/topoisomerase IV subunit B
MKSKEYDASHIEVVQNVDHVRARPGMYIADTRKAGMHQLAREVLSNSVDEYMGGHATEIRVTLVTKDNTLTIWDDGRGIPVGIHPKTNMSALATVFLIAGAGGKFSQGAYSVSAGLHGVGVTVVNALSSRVRVASTIDSVRHYLEFQQGKLHPQYASGIPTKKPASHKHGTQVTFTPDEDIFGKKCKFDPDVLRTMLKDLSYLCAGLTFAFQVDEEELERYHQEDGLKGFIEDHVAKEKCDALHPVQLFKSDAIEVAFCWTNASDEKWFSYVNSSPTPLGGTHVTGLKRLITNTIAPRATKAIENDDLRVGLRVAIHVKLKNPQFKGQTKDALQNKETASEVYEALKDTVSKFVHVQSKVVDSVISRATKLKSARERFERDKDASKNVVTFNRNKRGVLPANKFAEAPDCKPEERETFLVEGESAGGTVKQARNPYNQEVLGLKGKIPNALQKAKSSLLENEEIKMIITAVGAGIGDKCDPRKARISKLLLLMDADPDGAHITALMISFLNRYMAPIIDAGMVWVVRSPLFKAQYKDQNIYGDTLEEVMRGLPKNAKPQITRFKGHGEAEPEDLQYYAMNQQTRRLLRITRDDATDAGLQALMGADAGARRLLLGLDQDPAQKTQ